jgi:hypothetical protein
MQQLRSSQHPSHHSSQLLGRQVLIGDHIQHPAAAAAARLLQGHTGCGAAVGHQHGKQHQEQRIHNPHDCKLEHVGI